MAMTLNSIIQGDCLEVMKKLEDNSVDAVVTDPPYGLSFMGKKWDYDVPSQEIWEECLRVLKPGGYLLSFAGTRTYHRMAVRIEDAGFEIRDMIAWVYASGFPKSLNIGKAVDKLQGNERTPYERPDFVARSNKTEQRPSQVISGEKGKYTKGTSEWEGWGTALKPALEPITVARKPLSEKTVAENVLKWGTGGINIDGSRIGYKKDDWENRKHRWGKTIMGGKEYESSYFATEKAKLCVNETGRFPANIIHDGSNEVVSLFPNTGGGKYQKQSRKRKGFMLSGSEDNIQEANAPDNYGDSGSASRFFYCAKSSKSERNKGCEDMPDNAPAYESHRANYATTHGIETPFAGAGRSGKDFKNNHPTVKPIALMEYLVKLVSREGSVVLDPFAGSGSTLIACKKLGRNYIGIELESDYVKIAEARIKAHKMLQQLSINTL